MWRSGLSKMSFAISKEGGMVWAGNSIYITGLLRNTGLKLLPSKVSAQTFNQGVDSMIFVLIIR